MRVTGAILLIIIPGVCSFSQNTLRAVIKDADAGTPLPGASAIIQGTMTGGISDGEGNLILKDIPNGTQSIEISSVGYQSQRLVLAFPLVSPEPLEILLMRSSEELEEILVSSTRSSRTIADIPTRIEIIAGEELNEKSNMKPGDIRMLLSESTGIQTQQTSPTSANASIRIQGLDGRYTQILKDGFPVYSGFSGGLGLLQTPPLDLKRVEVIKGSTSTLYGGGAIAGLVNLISRDPGEEREISFMINGTSAGGLDVSGFYGDTFGKTGLTVFGSRNSSEPYDPADIGLTAIPKFERYTFNPRLFFEVGPNTDLNIGINFSTEDRIGGDIQYIKGNGDVIHSYFESNESNRLSTQFFLSHKVDETKSINLKNSINHFDRLLEEPSYRFDGIQNSSFTELNYVDTKENLEWIVGANVWTESFSEKPFSNGLLRDYNHTTAGLFVQNAFTINDKISLESGIRGDYVFDYGFALLPRISLLYETSSSFSTRIGGGFGYKTPTIFTEESERIQFENLLPVTPDKNSMEKSYGANWDLNLRANPGDVGLSINHLFFYTYLDNPLAMIVSDPGYYELVNLPGFIDSKGTETNVRVEFGDFKLFLGYTFTDTRIRDGDVTVQNPLTAKHRLNNVLMYEVEEKLKAGLEAYYFSEQRLTDGTFGKEYWICGFMVEKLWEGFSLFINFENFLDVRQTRFDTIYTGSITDPSFRDIYAPVDGFVVNGGLKLQL